MASRNMMIGTGAALAGVGGLAVAALSVDSTTPQTAAAGQTVETRTVVVRTVEHRVKRASARRNQHAQHAATAARRAAAPATPVVQAAPVPVAATPALVTNPAPIRTRASGGSGRGGDDGAEHETENHNGGDDSAEHADD